MVIRLQMVIRFLAVCIAVLLAVAIGSPLDSFLAQRTGMAATGGELGPGSPAGTVAGCADRCLARPECISFNWAAGQCQLNGHSRVWAVNPANGSGMWQRLQPRDDSPARPAVRYPLEVPVGGVQLHRGPLRGAFEGGLEYLLQYSVDDLLFMFRARAGLDQPAGARCHGWDCRRDWVEGSLAGLFLMGSGGHLRWEEHAELRGMMDRLIDGIEAAAQPNGFLAAFDEERWAVSEHPDYTTSWTVHGFLEAAIGGNGKALRMIRRHMSLFNNHSLIPTFLPPDGGNWPWQEPLGRWPSGVDNKTKVGGPGTGHTVYLIAQGIIHNTRMALSALGTQADVELVGKLYQEDWWLRALAARDKQVIGRKLFDAHNYQITAVEAYMDMYQLTANSTYLEAVLGAWQMHRNPLNGWIHVGGSIAINEGAIYDPGTYHLMTGDGGTGTRGWPTGEFCGAVFWLKLNQRLHRLWPDNETFVGEIERELFNEGLGHQDRAGRGIRYFSVLNGRKQASTNIGTCCEGQGSRLYGSLPEYLFSPLANRTGLYVDIYQPASIVTELLNATVNVTVETDWPYSPKVRVTVLVSQPTSFGLALRIPAWVAQTPVMIYEDAASHPAYAGQPGTYLHINRSWDRWHSLDFELPGAIEPHLYTGIDQIGRLRRFSYTHGSTLLAVVGAWNSSLEVQRLTGLDPAKPTEWMIPAAAALHWTVAGHPGVEVLPAWEITDNATYFSVYPAFD